MHVIVNKYCISVCVERWWVSAAANIGAKHSRSSQEVVSMMSSHYCSTMSRYIAGCEIRSSNITYQWDGIRMCCMCVHLLTEYKTSSAWLKSAVCLTPIQSTYSSHSYLQFVTTTATSYQPVSVTWTPRPLFEKRSSSGRVSIAVLTSSTVMQSGCLLTRIIDFNTLEYVCNQYLIPVWHMKHFIHSNFNEFIPGRKFIRLPLQPYVFVKEESFLSHLCSTGR